MYEIELEAAKRIAVTAGSAILEHYAGTVVEESKMGVDNFAEPVTAADREASRIIVAALADGFPADGILSEEEEDNVEVRLGRERTWIIDPIDGTSGFIKKDGDFSVQIGLAHHGEPVVGVVLLPAHGRLFWASKGSGAYRQSDRGETVRLHVSDTEDPTEMLMAISRNHRSSKMTRVVEEFGFKGAIQRGSVGLKVGLIAERTCDAYIHLSPRTKMWDTCAPQIILEEAGGRLTDLWGNRYRYDIGDVQNWGGIVATNGTRHDEMIQRLRPILLEFGRDKIVGPI